MIVEKKLIDTENIGNWNQKGKYNRSCRSLGSKFSTRINKGVICLNVDPLSTFDVCSFYWKPKWKFSNLKKLTGGFNQPWSL